MLVVTCIVLAVRSIKPMQVKGWQPFVKVLIQSYLFANIVITVILILLIKILLAVVNNESVLCGLALANGVTGTTSR